MRLQFPNGCVANLTASRISTERVRKLRDSRSEQELEIRRQLRYQREGETSIMLPDQKPAK